MARFLTKLNVECIEDDRWRLISPLLYESDIAGSITVPSGFETDFASVPRIPVAYLFFGDEAHMAAVVHDYLCRCKEVDRKTADKVFKEAMKISGVGWKRFPMYLAVRIYGAICYA